MSLLSRYIRLKDVPPDIIFDARHRQPNLSIVSTEVVQKRRTDYRSKNSKIRFVPDRDILITDLLEDRQKEVLQFDLLALFLGFNIIETEFKMPEPEQGRYIPEVKLHIHTKRDFKAEELSVDFSEEDIVVEEIDFNNIDFSKGTDIKFIDNYDIIYSQQFEVIDFIFTKYNFVLPNTTYEELNTEFSDLLQGVTEQEYLPNVYVLEEISGTKLEIIETREELTEEEEEISFE